MLRLRPQVARRHGADVRATCGFRVPDHTDFVDCGKKAVREDRCEEHLKVDVRNLRLQNRMLRGSIAQNNAKIKALLGKA